MSMLALYTIFVLIPGLQSFFSWGILLTILIAVVTIITSSILAAEEPDANALFLGYVRRAKLWLTIAAMFVCVFFSTILPDQKQVAILAGGYIVTNNEQLAKLPANVLKLANGFLEKYQKVLEDKDEKKK